MTSLRILPADRVPFSAVEAVLSGVGESSRCWCRWWMLDNAAYTAHDAEARRSALVADHDAGRSPGLVALEGDAPVGWVGVAPRPRYARLPRTKVIASAVPEGDWADDSVWSIVCFTVPREHRGRGIASELLAAAVDHALEHGATVAEAYPVDTTTTAAGGGSASSRRSPGALNTGTLSLFTRHEFTEVGRSTANRPIVRKVLRE